MSQTFVDGMIASCLLITVVVMLAIWFAGGQVHPVGAIASMIAAFCLGLNLGRTH